MRVYKRLALILLLMPTLALANAFTSAVESNIAPSDGGGDTGNSAEIQTLEDQVQMRNVGKSQAKPLYQIQNRPASSGQTLTTKASISADGKYYCPPKQGYTTASVSPYKPNGYAQCIYH
ncbi:MAG: hypothetical protein P1U63_06090 [Coxiellaceae bacterium]|nr:hypothetical protein [Coxiellaceae bacterium]